MKGQIEKLKICLVNVFGNNHHDKIQKEDLPYAKEKECFI